MAESGAIILSNEIERRFKIVTGEKALDGSNPTPLNFSGQLSKILGAVVTLKGSAAPGVSPHLLSYDISGTTLNVYVWKATGVADTTLIAGTDTDTFSYLVFGY